jgi:hypothetical protein
MTTADLGARPPIGSLAGFHAGSTPLTRSRSRRRPFAAISTAIAGWLSGPAARPQQHRQARRESFMENAAMSREMHRL